GQSRLGTTTGFIALAEQVSGQQLDTLFHDWLFTPSPPPRPASMAPGSGEAAPHPLPRLAVHPLPAAAARVDAHRVRRSHIRRRRSTRTALNTSTSPTASGDVERSRVDHRLRDHRRSWLRDDLGSSRSTTRPPHVNCSASSSCGGTTPTTAWSSKARPWRRCRRWRRRIEAERASRLL